MAIGDLIFNLMGQPDPRRQLAAALQNQSMPPNGTLNTQGQLEGGPGAGGTPSPTGSGQVAQAGGAPPAGPGAQPPAAPPQPQAYQSPPDLGQMYMNLVARDRANAQIDRGAGLLFGAFAAPQDRGPMLQAMTSGGSGAGGIGGSNAADIVENLGKIYQMQTGMAMTRQMYQNAPTFARQLNIPVEQVYALIAQGKLPEIMQDAEKQRLLQADPLHQAQVASSQAEVPLKQAQTGSAVAETGVKQADIAMKNQDIAARAKLLGSVPDIAKATGMDPVVLAAMPPDKLADIAAKASEPTEASKNYKQARAELAAQGFNEQQVNALAPPEMLIAGASSDPSFRSYIQQRATAMKADPNSPAALQSFEQFKQAAAVSQQTASELAKQKTTAQQSLDSLRAQYDKQRELIDNINKDPNLSEITGQVAGRVPTSLAPFIAGRSNTQQAKDLQAQIDQLSKMGFISGAHAVREAVGGRVTQNEAQAGANAENRLSDQSQSTEAYKASIRQLKEESDRNMAIAYHQAGIPIPDDLADVKEAATKLAPGVPPPSGGAAPRRRVYDAQGNLK